MFQEKNLTPRQLSALSALIISVFVSLGIIAMGHSWREGLIAFGMILIGTYLLLFFIIERFIFRKLKLIYKFIFQTKANKKQESYYKYILPPKSIDEVRKEVEEWGKQQAQEIETLERERRFRTEFLQNLSHELKTPVFAIQGYIETLLNGASEDKEITKSFLQKAEKNIQRLTHLLDDVDQISGLERGELTLNKNYFVIQDLVREVFETLSPKAAQKNISLSIKKGCEFLLSVYADKEKIRQVLTNLVDNAIKYGRLNGHVTASIYRTDGETILIEISDDGMGIPPQYTSRVFERFYRTPEGRSADITGSGLGLAICKHIVEAHGHSIHVRSSEGVGTTIGFTLDGKNKRI